MIDWEKLGAAIFITIIIAAIVWILSLFVYITKGWLILILLVAYLVYTIYISLE